jgi:RNA polymerase sigma factor (sigma-70 family)
LQDREHPDLLLVHAAVGGDGRAAKALIERLLPVVRTRALANRARCRAFHVDPHDLVQEVLALLFEDHGAALLKWDPTHAHATPLEGWVNVIADHKTRTVLKKKRVPVDDDAGVEDTAAESGRGAERRLLSKDELGAVVREAVASGRDPDGEALFQLVYVEEVPLEQVSLALGKSRDAIDQWKHRFAARARKIAARLASESAASREGRAVPDELSRPGAP